MNNNKWNGHIAIIVANTIFGLGVPVTKLLLDQWVSPMGYMASRSLFAALIFWALSLFTKREHVERRDLIVIMGGGLLGFVISQTLTSFALNYTTPVYFSLVASLTPVAVMLLAALFIGERVTPLQAVGVVLGIAGAALMVFIGWQAGAGKNDLLGIILAILSVLTWAIYLIVTRRVSSKYSPVTQMKWVFLISAVVTVPIALSGDLGRLYTQEWAWSGVAEMAFIVVFATVVGFFLIPYAMKYLRATTVSIYTNLQPVVASLVAIALSQDVLTWDKPIAALLVLLGAYIVTIQPKDKA